MNCANHPENAAIAYCRTCGKPLCASCTRDVKGVIYCENCLAERLAGVQPVAGQPLSGVAAAPVPVAPSSGPNPTVAGILAGFFPFGVGAVYTGQYAKGLAHLLIFVGLVFGLNQSDPLETTCAFAFAFFDHVAINWTWQLAELFKIEKGKIRRVEAVFHKCPYGTNSGWSNYEQGISEEYRSIK